MAVLTIGMMDAPDESQNLVTGLRIVDAALRNGHHVNVFLHEEAVALHEPREWILELFAIAARKGLKLDWVHCGRCSDERGIQSPWPGARRGSPIEFLTLAQVSQGFLHIATK